MAKVYWRNDDGVMEPVGSEAWLALEKTMRKSTYKVWWKRWFSW